MELTLCLEVTIHADHTCKWVSQPLRSKLSRVHARQLLDFSQALCQAVAAEIRNFVRLQHRNKSEQLQCFCYLLSPQNDVLLNTAHGSLVEACGTVYIGLDLAVT